MGEHLHTQEAPEAATNAALYTIQHACLLRSSAEHARPALCLQRYQRQYLGAVHHAAMIIRHARSREAAQHAGLRGLPLYLRLPCRFEWDLSDPKGGETALHVAARLDDEGCMAGLLLTRCPRAQQLWSSVTNMQGETPASIVLRCGKRLSAIRPSASWQHL